MLKFLLITLFLISCGKAEKPAVPKADSRIEMLREKHNQMLVKAALSFDGETQWPSTEDCDALLWAGLSMAVGIEVDTSLAETKPGVMQRRPYKPCWTKEQGDLGSKSTISNDMLLGYMLGLWRTGDLAALKRLADYGEKHAFVMGEPFPEMASRVLLKPNQIALLGKAMHALSGGKIDKGYRHIPMIYSLVSKDYERHLQAISLLFLSELRQAERSLIDLKKDELKRLDALVKAEPDNPFFLSIQGIYTGDFKKPITILLDENAGIPAYVRGHENYKLVHWLVAGDVVLRSFERATFADYAANF